MREKYFKWKYFKPAVTLGLITTVMSTILIVTASLIPDMSGVMTDKLHAACVELMGEGEFSIMELDNLPNGVNKLIIKEGTLLPQGIAFEITATGYNPDSITALVAMNNNGTIRGVYLLSVKDSPGYDKRVNTPDFLSQFTGATADSQFDSVTGATRSSEGVIKAINIAIETYERFGELGVYFF